MMDPSQQHCSERDPNSMIIIAEMTVAVRKVIQQSV
jgi:hypothetical protein